MKRNITLFEQTTKRLNLLVEKHRDKKEKSAFKMALLGMKPLIDEKILEGIQPVLGSTQTCEEVLVKIGEKGMDLEVKAAGQLAAINE